MAHVAIRADGVTLRPSTLGDLAMLRSFFDDPEFNEHWGGVSLPDSEIIAKYTGRRSPGVESFLVEQSGVDIGYMQYCVADDGGEGGGIDLALLPAARGKGVGTAVVHAMAHFLRSERGWNRITVDPDVSNPRGVSFWKAVGFVPEQLVESDPERKSYWIMSWPEHSKH